VKEPVWLLREFVLAVHEQSLAQFGGAAGVRDPGLLESALDKPRNRLAYGKPDLFDLAASYCDGIVRNHPFVDGNKRTAFIAAIVFLERNGYAFGGAEADATLKTLALAAGELSAKDFARWLKTNSKRS
jgi:death-on-curing protein